MTYVTETIQLFKEDGIQQGVQQGVQQGIQQGIQQKAREDVVEVLTLRFSDPHPAIVERIHTVDDTTLLKTLHRQAVLAESLEKFQQFMEKSLSETSQPEDPSAA